MTLKLESMKLSILSKPLSLYHLILKKIEIRNE